MDSKKIQSICLFLVFALICPSLTVGQGPEPIKLPDPQTDIGRPLMQVLKDRASSRAFSSEKLPDQVLSNLLWAAFGINRQESGKRTAPSAMNRQEIDIYVTTAEGLFLYDATAHALQPILSEDIRALTGGQDFVKRAPVNLVYVADFSKTGQGENAQDIFYPAVDTGFISQNVYLYCASEGLATVVRGWVDKPTLEKAMNLRPEQKVMLAQTVGYPEK